MENKNKSLSLKDFYDNPHDLYNQLREKNPACYIESYDAWALSRYSDVKHALKHPEIYSSLRTTDILLLPWLSTSNTTNDFIIVSEDNPDHKFHRNFVGSFFTKISIAENDHVKHEITKRLIDNITPNHEFDFLSNIAYPFSEKCINLLLGISNNEKYVNLCAWAEMIEKAPLEADKNYLDQLTTYNNEISDYILQLIKKKARNPNNGLISKLIQHNKSGQLTDEQLSNLIELIIRAALQPVAHMLTRAIMKLSDDVELFILLKSRPEKIPAFINELFRHETIIHAIPRKTLIETSVAGTTIPNNSSIFLLLASANRDRKIYTNPDDFDITRNNSHTHLSFGKGIHRCLGEPTAKAQIRIFLEIFLSRFSRIECPSSDKLPWFYNFIFHSVESLPVRLT